MPVDINLHKPFPGMPLNISGTAANLQACLAPVVTVAHMLTAPSLVKMALDSGYGTSVSLMHYKGLTAADFKHLKHYLLTRLQLLQHLVAPTAVPGGMQISPVGIALDATEKGDAGYILGALGCRLAIQEWLSLEKGYRLRHFWHYSVFTNPAVTYGVVDVSGNNGQVGKSAPDYLVQDSNDTWYPVEAKGGFGTEGWARILNGLKQAWQVQAIWHIEPSTGVLLMHAPLEIACSQAHFKPTGELAVTLVDPPGDVLDADDHQPHPLEFVPEFAGLVNLHQACRQFAFFPRLLKRLPPLPEEAYAFNWGKLEMNSGLPVMVGIPKSLHEKSNLLADILDALGVIVPAVSAFFKKPENAPQAEAIRDAFVELLDAQLGLVESLHYESAPRCRAASLTRKLLQGMRQAVPNANLQYGWHSAMGILGNIDIQLPRLAPFNIFGLAKDLRGEVHASCHRLSLGADLDKRPRPADFLKVETCLHGLVVTSGTWPALSAQNTKKIGI